MINKLNHKMAVWAIMGSMLLTGTACQDKLADDAHYAAPSFLKGNAYEVLEKEGNYTIFLQGIDLIGYTDIVDSQILTVLAPNDEAFSAFLRKKGYSSIEEMYLADPDYVRQVITYHLLYYAMDWSKMTNFRPEEGDGATEEQKAVMAGMYNRFRTRCNDPETSEFNHDASVNDYVKVVHYDRYIPVYSQDMWNTIELRGREAYNYNYFFPSTPWNVRGLSHGFNVANAAVTDTAAVVTDNGYLYHVDQVIEPLKTIYDELKDRADYSTFFNLCDSYSYYTIDETESNNRGYTVYTHEMRDIPNIAREWPVNSYSLMAINMRTSYNVIAPSNEAMEKMFSNFWDEESGYGSVSELNPLILSYFIMQSFTNGNTTAWPDLIADGTMVTPYHTTFNIDLDQVSDRIVCCNGLIYGADNMDVPAIFSSVAGPAFKEQKYVNYLYALDLSEMMLTLASQQSKFVTLIPDTAQFTAERIRLYKGTEGDVLQQWNDEEANYVPIGHGSRMLQNMVNMNTTTNADELKTSGTQVIESNASFNYWYVMDGKITTNQIFNQQLNPQFTDPIWHAFHEIERGGGKTWDNGKAYAYDYPGIFAPADASSLENELSINNDRNYPYYVFSQLLRLCGLATNGVFASQLTLDPTSPRFFAFVPTNDALKEHLTELPGCSKLKIDANYKISGTLSSSYKQQLAAYMTSYFVTADRNSFTSYPYVGSPTKGTYDTGGDYGVNITDTGSSLTVNFTAKDKAPEGNIVNVVSTYHYLPFAFSDGAFQLIDGVLF